MKAYISRIEEVNPIINAVVDNRFEDAIRDAQYVDKLVASGKKSEDELAAETPFLGVPYTTKECFNTKGNAYYVRLPPSANCRKFLKLHKFILVGLGLHRCAGLVASKDFIAEEDAPAIQLMKNAGAILLGVTNTSELCMWWESQNKVYGRTCNPYKTTRIVGGSSGTEN